MGLQAGIRYLTTDQLAVDWQVTPGELARWASQGRIPGAIKVGRQWRIPEGAELQDPPHTPRLDAATEVRRLLGMP